MTRKPLLHFTLSIIICLALSFNTVYSAFTVKQEGKCHVNDRAATRQVGLTKYEQTIHKYSASKLRSLFYNSSGYPESKRNRGEAWGILSIFSGMTIILAPLAIIFGAIGVHKNRKNGAATVGLILGIVVTIAILIFLSTWHLTLAMNMGPVNFGPDFYISSTV